MESNCEALFWELSQDFKCAFVVIPNVNSFISTASHDQLLTNADVEASYLVFMEEALNIVERSIVGWTSGRFSIEESPNHLALAGGDVDIVLFGVDTHRLDGITAALVTGLVINRDVAFLAKQLQRGSVVHS